MKSSIWTILVLLLSSPCAYSQEEGSEPGGPAEVAAEEAAAGTEADSTEPEPVVEPDAAAQDPFDYRASEQISEDLSVSFPVDI